MELVGFDRAGLVQYVARQIRNVVPDGHDPVPDIADHLDEALQRLHICINAVRMWPQNRFDPLHSSQHCTFLYFLSHTIWTHTNKSDTPLRLFLLNKALNAIDCFYEVQLPEVFLIGHSVGIVLAKATYGNHLVFYQNSTVGKNHGVAPVLEDGVILYPNTAVIGNCRVRTGSVISQGASVINRDTQANSIAFQGANGGLVFKPSHHPILVDFFRDV
jgi:serine O-acetyltransferase